MKSQKTNWWLDAILYAGFLALFFLDLTGVDLHQWLGLTIGILALVHLVLHLDWVIAVTGKIFGNIPNSARFNLLLDTGIGIGFFLIIITGIVISTWLNLSFNNYMVWKNIHTLLSIFTLFALLLKLLLHRKWIVKTAGKCFLVEKNKRVPTQGAGVLAANKLARRDFLKVGAALGAGALIGVVQLHKVVRDVLDEKAIYSSIPEDNIMSGEVISPVEQTQPDMEIPQPELTATSEVQPTLAPVAVESNSGKTEECYVRCPRACSYPGRCRRYVDTNGNGRCDYGECL